MENNEDKDDYIEKEEKERKEKEKEKEKEKMTEKDIIKFQDQDNIVLQPISRKFIINLQLHFNSSNYKEYSPFQYTTGYNTMLIDRDWWDTLLVNTQSNIKDVLNATH